MKKITLISLMWIFLLSACKNNPANGESESSTAEIQDKENSEAVDSRPSIPVDERPAAMDVAGNPLYMIPESQSAIAKKDSSLEAARLTFNEDPSIENAVWYGRRMAYRGYYLPAISHYTQEIRNYPESPELYRHRGHRYITTRQFIKAVEDFEKAAELVKNKPIIIEPDGIPNKLNKPLSNLQFNIYYHLGLARYLQGNYSEALKAYEMCMRYSNNPDLKVATTDWMYLTYMRLGDPEKAKSLITGITTDMNIVENDSYFQRILMYKGEVDPSTLLAEDGDAEMIDIVTQGYGVANHYLHMGNEEKYKEILKDIISTGYWAAFGYIAAESDLHRMAELR